ncbi:SpaA isopeptide-forming pilin-related protein [Leucobacter triazinivorans]|uniref:DUF11 domain-containing protein n=1 Tax=Leucobacter triazinivorans TaxID=1784719 RepID=A0A4P6KFY8_9MICO|nr:SpaA isopeptide-forming pilin-related protein [Leucobacter triazinivorans]QBE49272.1 DUF11 domain-containing protein [Leucobacter triazinivorans]
MSAHRGRGSLWVKALQCTTPHDAEGSRRKHIRDWKVISTMTRAVHRLSHTGGYRHVSKNRIWVAIVAVVMLAIGLLSPAQAHADASSQPTLSIAALTPATQASGVAFNYSISYGCSNVNADPCATDPVITIPLGDAADLPIQVGANPMIVDWEVDSAGNLIIRLDDLVQGTSGVIGFTITPPNQTTPDGTSWTLAPTMTFSDDTPTVNAPGVTSTATAAASLDLTKTANVGYFHPGDVVVYSLAWDCPTAGWGYGAEDLTQLVLSDTLPAGLTYVSSSPSGAVVSGQTVTFTFSAAQLGDRCSKGSGTAAPVTISAQVDASIPDATVIENTATATGTSLSGATVTDSSSDDITVVDTIPGATTSKLGIGPLLNSVGDYQKDYNLNGYRSATYPGPWLGLGAAAQPSSSFHLTPLPNGTNDALMFRIEAMYQLDIQQGQPGVELTLTDPMPCTTNVSGAAYSSYPAGGALCTDPAFHPTLVTVRTPADVGRVGIPESLVVNARLTDGTVVALTLQASSGSAPNGATVRTYRVPDSVVGQVAEISIPRTAGMTNTRTQVLIGGYVDEDRNAGDLIRNQGTVESFVPEESSPYAASLTSIGTIYVKEGPQIGAKKAYSTTSKSFTLTSEVFLSGETTGDLTFTDTLPAGWAVDGPISVDVAQYTPLGYVNDIDTTTSVAADPSTGRTTLTVVVTAETINSLLDSGLGERFRFEVNVPSKAPSPGSYSNTVSVNLSDPGTQSMCLQGTAVSGLSGADFTCRATTSFVVNPDPTSEAVQVVKSVRGSNDTSFKTFPAIGYVEGTGGTATFRLDWTNKSIASMTDVVVYDLLPTPGDTGTIPTTVDQQRGSTFEPTLASIAPLPAGISAYYSVSDNPCRPEVLPNADNPGCVDDWTAMPASPSAALLQQITALKFVSSQTYAFNTGFRIEINMTTPSGITDSDIAWNTFAASQTNADSGQVLPAVEAARVGVAHKDYSHITIDKVVDQAQAHVGEELTYTVTAVNDGGRDLSNITLRDTLPDGVDFVGASDGGTHAAGVVTWQLAAMPLGQVFAFTVTVTIAEGNTVPEGEDGVVLVNRWGVDGPTPVTPLNPCPEPNDANESCATTEILGALQWSKVTTTGALLAGSEWTLQQIDGAGEPTGDLIAITDCEEATCAGPDQDPEPGTFLIVGLDPGTYQLIETRAPFGYVLDSSPHSVDVLSSTAITVMDGIVNEQQPGLNIPLTGGVGTVPIVLGGVVAGAVALLLVLVRRRRVAV